MVADRAPRRARGTWLERQVFWLPYAALALVIATDYALGPLVRDGHWRELGRDGRPVLPILALLCTVAVGALCVRPATRARALGLTALATIVVFGALSLVEARLPPIERSTDFQRALQGQLERRATVIERTFRGVEWVQHTTALGWVGADWPVEPAAGRIVFVGDSFLESAASRTLAERVEARLVAGGWNGDIVNLSKFSTAPDPEYRHRFHELALEYRPDHVVLFLYSGNDLHRSYLYEPYRHPVFGVSERALGRCRDADLGVAALDVLERARRARTVWTDKASFLAELDGLGLDFDGRHLAYLLCLAYAEPDPGSWTERRWGRALGRLAQAGDALQPIKRRLQGRRPPLTAAVQADFNALFELPHGRRLDALIEFLAAYYGPTVDGGELDAVVRALPAAILDHVLAEPDSPALFLRALWIELTDEDEARPADASQVDRIRREYAALIAEFQARARELGIGFSVVMIPQAGVIDRAFRAFWSPLLDTAAQYEYRDVARRALFDELDGSVPVLDLGQHPQRFDDGYWKLDGHWNEAGHDAAADLVVEHLRSLAIGL